MGQGLTTMCDRRGGRNFAAMPRTVALAVIAVLILFLGYLRLSGDDDAEVPRGAHAGQLVDLHPCTYDKLKADCGTLVVAENRHATGSRLIAVPVPRIRAASKHPAEPIFRLE